MFLFITALIFMFISKLRFPKKVSMTSSVFFYLLFIYYYFCWDCFSHLIAFGLASHSFAPSFFLLQNQPASPQAVSPGPASPHVESTPSVAMTYEVDVS